MLRKSCYLVVGLLMGLAFFVPGSPVVGAETQKTEITVHALSQGAKFIGSSMEGARITVTNLETGKVLAEGITSGSTGNTDRIMRQQHGRNRVFATPEAAGYTTKLQLDEPTRVKITAYGPLSNPEDANSASITQTLLPGKDLTGDASLVLQVPGFIMDVLSVKTDSSRGESRNVTVKSSVSMMCGCPIEPDGLWDAKDYEIRVRVYKNGTLMVEEPMNYAGQSSRFKRTLSLASGQYYQIVVYAYDPITGNTGYERTSLSTSNS